MLGTMVTDGLLDPGLGDPAALPILLDFRTQSVEPALRLEFEQGAPHGIHLLLGQTVDLLVQERSQIFRIDIGKCAHGAKIATGRVLFQTIPPLGLDGLAQSANARNARMGRWSLRSLEEAAEASLSELRAQHRSAGVFACRSAGVPLASRAAAERAPHFRHRVRSAR